MKINEIISVLEKFAPPALAEEWDNVGLMLGDASKECEGVMTALDLTLDVVRQAEDEGCNLIVTHHPFIFRPLKSIDFSMSKGRAVEELVSSGIAVYSMHTNLDKAEKGMNYTLASMLGGEDITLDGEGAIFKVKPQSPSQFAKLVARALGDDSVRLAGKQDGVIEKVYVVSGSGGSEYGRAREVADALLTGDLKHHDYIDAAEDGFALIEFSHFASETIMQDIVAEQLKNLDLKVKKAKQNRPFRLLEEI